MNWQYVTSSLKNFIIENILSTAFSLPCRFSSIRIIKLISIEFQFTDILFQYSANMHCMKNFLFGVFLVHIFPHSDGIQRDTPYLSVFSLNAGKCGPKKHRKEHFSSSNVNQLLSDSVLHSTKAPKQHKRKTF